MIFNRPPAKVLSLLGLLLVCCGGLLAAENRVIVITPHNEAIRYEFGRGFSLWHEQRYGAKAAMDWRDLGGTTDALRFVQSEFTRKPAGIGIDCFFGGGPEPFLFLADQGLTMAYQPPPKILQGIPQSFSGVQLYDPAYNWFGAALSSFGILQNRRVQSRLRLPLVARWEELDRPQLNGWVGAGDPRNSGTMNAMYEGFLQAYGWETGWEKLTAIAANVRKFDRISSSTAKDVTLGETAYAFAIDFYAFTQIAAAGRTNLTFVLPQDFSAIIPDGIALLKGGPNPETSRRFIDFVLGDAGQQLWFLPRGHPKGPQQYSIERMPVRPDLYRRYQDQSNIAFSPFQIQQASQYDPILARERREVVAALFGALLVDPHDELKAAWRQLQKRGVDLPARRLLGQMPMSQNQALQLAKGAWRDPAVRNQQKIDWQIWARQKYRRLERNWLHETSIRPPRGEKREKAGGSRADANRERFGVHGVLEPAAND